MPRPGQWSFEGQVEYINFLSFISQFKGSVKKVLLFLFESVNLKTTLFFGLY